MNQDFLLSVVIPFYNVEKYMDCLFMSLLEQIDASVEVICIEDCSTDKTKAKLKEYQKIYFHKNIRFIYLEQNSGLSEVRNKGIKHANGKYIWFIDSDDVVVDGAIRKILNSIRMQDTDIIFFNYYILFDEEKCPYRNQKEEIYLAMAKQNIATGYKKNKEKFLVEYIKNNKFYAWMFIAKRSLYIETDFQFPSGKYFEDISSMPLLVWRSGHIFFSTIPILYYRQRESSIIGNITYKNRLDLSKAFDPIIDYFSTINITPDLLKTIWAYHLLLKKVAFWDLYIEGKYDNHVHHELLNQLQVYRKRIPFNLREMIANMRKNHTFVQILFNEVFIHFPKCYFKMQKMKVLLVIMYCKYFKWEKCKYYTKKFKNAKA